jgi:pimeloyl-ACP methyl ester carboxylesterase
MTWLLAVAGLVLLLAGAAQALALRIERAHPPKGRFVPVEGGRLHVVEGAAPAAAGVPSVLLVHGASGNSADMMLALAARLGDRHHVVAVDRPGHGWSDRPGGRADSAPARQAALIREALAGMGVGRVVVVGHSLAGVIATRLALDHPDMVAGLVLVSPVTHPWPGGVAWYYDLAATPVVGPLFARTLAPLAGRLLMEGGIRGSFAPESPPPDYAQRSATPLVLRPRQFEANAQDVADLLVHVEAQAGEYGRIAAPTTVIHGESDTVTSATIHSRAVAAQIAGSRLILLPGAGHMPHHVHTETVAGAIVEIVERVRRLAQAR